MYWPYFLKLPLFCCPESSIGEIVVMRENGNDPHIKMSSSSRAEMVAVQTKLEKLKMHKEEWEINCVFFNSICQQHTHSLMIALSTKLPAPFIKERS